jgi:hypothetical protein
MQIKSKRGQAASVSSKEKINLYCVVLNLHFEVIKTRSQDTERFGTAAMLLDPIQDGSHLGRDTGDPHYEFTWFSSVPPGEF